MYMYIYIVDIFIYNFGMGIAECNRYARRVEDMYVCNWNGLCIYVSIYMYIASEKVCNG